MTSCLDCSLTRNWLPQSKFRAAASQESDVCCKQAIDTCLFSLLSLHIQWNHIHRSFVLLWLHLIELLLLTLALPELRDLCYWPSWLGLFTQARGRAGRPESREQNHQIKYHSPLSILEMLLTGAFKAMFSTPSLPAPPFFDLSCFVFLSLSDVFDAADQMRPAAFEKF